jgi:MATE family, multidrug efflux pump
LQTLEKPIQGVSVGSLWRVAFPIMIATASIGLMVFADRLILAHYSIDAMNAMVGASTLMMVFIVGFMAITGITEVFVGQYHGANRDHEVGPVVWQMLWFSLASALIFIPAAIYLPPYAMTPTYYDMATTYFRWLMAGGIIFPLYVALASFYVGRGKVKLVLSITLAANLLNVILDIALIFGIQNLIPALGIAGSAMATIIAQSAAIIVLWIVFLTKSNRTKFHSHHYRFDWLTFYQSFRIGLPAAIGNIVELSAWAILVYLMTVVGKSYITVFAICQSIIILFQFYAIGINKGVIAIVANLIGSGQINLVKRLILSCFKLNAGFALVLALPLFIFPEILEKLFMIQDHTEDLRQALFWLWVFLIFDAMMWSISGILTAAGDTKFVMLMSAFSSWVFSVLPIYIFVFYFQGSIYNALALFSLYGLLNFLCFYLRYHSGKWKTLHVI